MRVLALDLGGSAIKHGLVEDGRLMDGYQSTPSDGHLGGPALLARAEQVAAAYAGYERIGVCSTGQINPQSGLVTFANENIPHYTGTDLRGFFARRFCVPVAVENDVNAMAIAEGECGAARGFADYICLTYGTGIGGAIVIGGRLYHGAGYSAGELGHLVTHVGGRPCACGGRGCYEQYASGKALSRAAKAAGLAETTGEALLARPGDETARQVLEAWLEELAAGLLSVLYTFNPACLVLGGAVMENPAMLRRVEAEVRARLMPSFGGVRFVSAGLGNAAGLLGAAYLAERQ